MHTPGSSSVCSFHFCVFLGQSGRAVKKPATSKQKPVSSEVKKFGFWWTCDAHNTISKLVNVAKSFQGRGASPVWRQFFWRRCNARVWGINCVAPTRAGCPSILFWIQPEATQQSSSRKRLTLPSWPSRGYGATAARLTPDQKVGSSNLSGLIWLGLKRPGPIMRIFYYTTLRLCACDLHL